MVYTCSEILTLQKPRIEEYIEQNDLEASEAKDHCEKAMAGAKGICPGYRINKFCNNIVGLDNPMSVWLWILMIALSMLIVGSIVWSLSENKKPRINTEKFSNP